MTKFSRRDFLKLSSIASLTANAQLGNAKKTIMGNPDNKPNILFILFDTLSAENISLYGYGRKTMPFLEKFAESATVFHNHYSPGNYTMPGTSSLLTSAYPWNHRGFHLYAGVIKEYVDKNLFSAFSKAGYSTTTFTHNPLVNFLLSQFHQYIDKMVLTDEIALIDQVFSDTVFLNDFHIAQQAERSFSNPVNKMPKSLFWAYIIDKIVVPNRLKKLKESIIDQHPLGPHFNFSYAYLLEDTIDWMMESISSLPAEAPYLGYYHLFPPHFPYVPRKGFFREFFDDGFRPPKKPLHHFKGKITRKSIAKNRRVYDEFILNVDSEFNRLYNYLESNNLLENTWLIFTSDHGEMFERGIYKHLNPSMYEALIHIPLLIKAPGQTERIDVHTATSSIDVLPTLLHIAGEEVPSWAEGQVLPPYRQGQPEQDRTIYATEAKSNPKYGPLKLATFVSIRWPYKLIYYRGYKGFKEVYELYNLELDPDELDDLVDKETIVLDDLKKDLLAQIEKADQPYRSK